ncbi:MAG: toll/interleukin-1 receptor domain-containing protein [Betaproteobacteria bacterium]|nr:toll/interleukin-1 receptor domain-containing protein [Betaproteobacteria bacterium]
MRDIFLNYRRADTAGHAGRLTDLLDARFGRGTVFRDVESIDGGTDFVQAIQRAVGSARLMLVLIGNTWTTETTHDGTRRLDDPDDFVRLEIATALRHGLPVLPVLVEGAQMPTEGELPEDLKPLARVQAVELTEARWQYDTGRLVDAIARIAPVEPRRRRGERVSRGIRYLLAAALVAAAIGGAWYVLGPSSAASLEGVWNLPTGSFWTVWKDGASYRVEETHHESKQVWRRGTGRMQDGDAFVVDLDPVFEPPGRHHFHYELNLAAEGRMLAGTVRETVKGGEERITLVRQ